MGQGRRWLRYNANRRREKRVRACVRVREDITRVSNNGLAGEWLCGRC